MARDAQAPQPPGAGPSTFQLWFEEAWQGWIRPLGLIALLGAAFLGYRYGLLREELAGVGLVLVVIGGAMLSTVTPALGRLRSARARAGLLALCGVWLLASGYPALRRAWPPAALAEVQLTEARPSATLRVADEGPYELTVSGRLKQAGGSDAEASYSIQASGGGGRDAVSGAIRRSLVRMRTSRRGGASASVQEHTEETHRIEQVRGGELVLVADGVDEQLDGGLRVTVRPAGPPLVWFLVLGVLALLCGAGFDARLFDPRTRAKVYLAPAIGGTTAFAIDFWLEATPHSQVRPAVAALFLGLVLGGLGGWMLGGIARRIFGRKAIQAGR